MHYFHAGWLKLVGYLIKWKNKRVINIPFTFDLCGKKENHRTLILNGKKISCFKIHNIHRCFRKKVKGWIAWVFFPHSLSLSLFSCQLREKAYSKTKLLSGLKYMYMHNSATFLWNSDIVLYHLHVKLYCNLWKLVFWH